LFGLVGLASLGASVVVFVLATKGTGGDADEPPEIPGTDVEVRERIGDPDPARVAPSDQPPNDTPAPADPNDFEAEAPKPPPAAPSSQPAPAPATAAATKGTLKIRSNRRVLVYVNEKVVGYTPQVISVEPGKYRIKAMMPGQPNTQQQRDANVTSPGQTVNVDMSF
jgi:hypothetical protein